MSDKLSGDIDNNGASHHEKHEVHDLKETDLTETAGRRSSVALNIVENPLKVRLIALMRSRFGFEYEQQH